MTLEEVRMNPDTQTLFCHSRGVPTDGAGAALRSCYTFKHLCVQLAGLHQGVKLTSALRQERKPAACRQTWRSPVEMVAR